MMIMMMIEMKQPTWCSN